MLTFNNSRLGLLAAVWLHSLRARAWAAAA